MVMMAEGGTLKALQPFEESRPRRQGGDMLDCDRV